MRHNIYKEEVADLQSENNYLLRKKICAQFMRDVLQRQAIELDRFAHKAKTMVNCIHAETFSDMAMEARKAIAKWDNIT